MLVKIAGLKSMYQNVVQRIAAHPEGKDHLLAGMLIPTIAAGDGLMHSTLFHEEGKSRASEFGVGALSGGIAGAIIAGGDVLGGKMVKDGENLLKQKALDLAKVKK